MSRMRDDILSDPAKTDEKPAMSLGQTLADTFFAPRVGDGAQQSRAELAALVDAAIAAEREACAKIADMTSQLDEVHELLRAALEIIRKSGQSRYVQSAYQVTTHANGGGDGMCVAEEIEDYFYTHDVPREPQFPEIAE